MIINFFTKLEHRRPQEFGRSLVKRAIQFRHIKEEGKESSKSVAKTFRISLSVTEAKNTHRIKAMTRREMKKKEQRENIL